MVEIIPNWHPIFVNFTVALFLVATLLYSVALLAPNAPWRQACLGTAHWNLALAAGFALITVGTGLNAYYSVAHDSPSHAAMTDHRNWALVTASAIVAMGLWQWMRRRSDSQPHWILAVALVLAGGLLTVTAWKGAELVFRYGLGVMALVEAEEPGHSHEHGNDDHESPDPATDQEDEHSAHTDHAHGSHASSAAKDSPTYAVITFHAALSGGDKQAAIESLAPDVLIFESGGAERSREEYASHHMNSDMAFMQQMQRDVTGQNESVQGDTAWVVTETRIHGRYKDKDIDLISIETAVLARGEDGWKILHLHWSSRNQPGG